MTHDTIRYTVELDGDQYDHEALLEVLADFQGVTVTAQESVEE